MKDKQQKAVEAREVTAKKIGANMARLLDAKEVKRVGGAASGPSGRGAGH